MPLGRRGAALALVTLAACAPPHAPPPPPAPIVTSAPAPALQGIVRDAAGKPRADAVVALIPHFELERDDADPLPFTATVDAEGRFHFDAVPPGRYGLTAVAPGVAAGYGGLVTLAPGAPAASAEIKLRDGGFSARGTVTDAGGAPVADAVVQAVRLSEDEGDIFVTRTDAAGRYEIALPGGQPYFIVVDALPRPRAYQRIEPVAGTADFRLAPPPPPRPSVRGWFDGERHAIARIAPRKSFDATIYLREVTAAHPLPKR